MTQSEMRKAILQQHRESYDEHDGLIHLEWHDVQSRLGSQGPVIDEGLAVLVAEGYLEPTGPRTYDLTALGLAVTESKKSLNRTFPE